MAGCIESVAKILNISPRFSTCDHKFKQMGYKVICGHNICGNTVLKSVAADIDKYMYCTFLSLYHFKRILCLVMCDEDCVNRRY